ncbi:MAG: 50S ribosomal protein L30e [Zestosphaera sp.]
MSQEISLETPIKLLYKTGKVILGSRRAVKTVKSGKALGVIVASNIPKHLTEDIAYYARMSNIKVIKYSGSSYDLGAILGKPFPVSVIAVLDPGESRILEVGEQ